MTGPERRRFVRARPTHDLPAQAVLPGSGIVKESLSIVDISVGGMAIATEPTIAALTGGKRARIELSFGSAKPLLIEVELRWKTASSMGVQFVDLTTESSTAIRKYVSELLERGG